MTNHNSQNTPSMEPTNQSSRFSVTISFISSLLQTLLGRKSQTQTGSVLIYLVAVMLVGGALGAGIVSMTTSSTFTQLTYNQSDQARWLAQSGLEYANAFFKAQEDDMCNPNVDLETYIQKYTFNLASDNSFEIDVEGIEESGNTIEIDVKSTGIIENDSSLLSSKFELLGKASILCSNMKEYFYAAMPKDEIDRFIRGEGKYEGVIAKQPDDTPENRRWLAATDPKYESYITEGVTLSNDPSKGSEQLLFIPMELEEDCNDYIIRSVAWIDLRGELPSGGYGYGILFDTTLDQDDLYTESGYILQFDPGRSDGEIIIRQRSFEGTQLIEPERYRYNNRNFLPSRTEDPEWWEDLHYIMLRVTQTPYLRRLQATFFDTVWDDIEDYDMDELVIFDPDEEDSPWERRFSFSYFYDYEPDEDAVLYTGHRGWGVPTYFHYLSIEPLACEPFIVTGVIAEYLFEEDDDPGRDTSGNDFHAQDGGFTTEFKELPAYMYEDRSTCSYATFDGTDSGMSMGNVPLDLQDQLTVMAWVRKDGSGHESSWANIVTSAGSGGTNGRFWLQHNQDNTRYEFAVRTTQNRLPILSDSEPSNGWQHVAGVYDGSTIKMYVDGVLQNHQRALSGKIVDHDNFSFTIGRDATSRRFKGNIDEVRVFNRAMNTTEINEWRVETRPCDWEPSDVNFALVTLNDIELTGSSKIAGNVRTIQGNVELGYSTQIDGNLYIGSTTHVNRPSNVTGDVEEDTSTFDFCKFYAPKSTNNCGYLNVTSNQTLSTSDPDCYQVINITNGATLTVDVGNQDRILVVNELNKNDSFKNGNIAINGSGRLIIYVNNYFDMQSSSSYNTGGNANQLVVYYAGDREITKGGNTRYKGAIFAPDAHVKMTGSASLTGYVESRSYAGGMGNIVMINHDYHNSFKDRCYFDSEIGSGIVIVIDDDGYPTYQDFQNEINTTEIDENWVALIITEGVGTQTFDHFDFYAPEGITVEDGVELISTHAQGYVKFESDTGDIVLEPGVIIRSDGRANNEVDEIYLKTGGNIYIEGVELTARRYIHLEAGGSIYANGATLRTTTSSRPNTDINLKAGLGQKIEVNGLSIIFNAGNKKAKADPCSALVGSPATGEFDCP